MSSEPQVAPPPWNTIRTSSRLPGRTWMAYAEPSAQPGASASSTMLHTPSGRSPNDGVRGGSSRTTGPAQAVNTASSSAAQAVRAHPRCFGRWEKACCRTTTVLVLTGTPVPPWWHAGAARALGTSAHATHAIGRRRSDRPSRASSCSKANGSASPGSPSSAAAASVAAAVQVCRSRARRPIRPAERAVVVLGPGVARQARTGALRPASSTNAARPATRPADASGHSSIGHVPGVVVRPRHVLLVRARERVPVSVLERRVGQLHARVGHQVAFVMLDQVEQRRRLRIGGQAARHGQQVAEREEAHVEPGRAEVAREVAAALRRATPWSTPGWRRGGGSRGCAARRRTPRRGSAGSSRFARDPTSNRRAGGDRVRRAVRTRARAAGRPHRGVRRPPAEAAKNSAWTSNG
jgi:hypothetical protein